jgi:hypothetical protein
MSRGGTDRRCRHAANQTDTGSWPGYVVWIEIMGWYAHPGHEGDGDNGIFLSQLESFLGKDTYQDRADYMQCIPLLHMI